MDSSSNNHGKAPPKESSSDGRAPPKESSSEQSSSNTDSSPPPPHPPPMGPPNMMYYQQGPGYPGHGPPPQPYHPYPPQPGYPPYPNEYPPHGYNSYPGGPYYGGPQNYPAGGGGRGFFRGFIMCSCILFTAFFVATLVMALLLHPKLPIYKITSLTLTNFDTNTTLTGDWDMNITVQNPNDKLKGYFSGFKVDVIHKNDVIAISYVPDFVLEKHEEKLMGVKTSSSSSVNGMSFQKWDLDEMATEQKGGSITFEIRMASMTAFRSTKLSTRSAMVIALCEGVKVTFQNNTGTLDNGGQPVNCQLFM